MKFKAFILVAVFLFSTLTACIHAPKQAWTPEYNRQKLLKKQPKPKEEKKLHRVKAW